MCTCQRRVINPYTHKAMYVKCGVCPACLTEKAIHRVERIKNNDTVGYTTFLLSLTYARYNAPYIRRSEAYDFSKGLITELNVYRDVSYRWVRSSADYDMACQGTKKTHVLTTIDFSDDIPSITGVKDLSHEFDKIGVCYYPDLQQFFARLRLNLKRFFNYDKPFTSYNCSEYGTASLRPHFHVAMHIPKADAEIFRAAINKSWPFSNILMFKRSFEEALSCSSYVASYVNCGSKFPNFLKRTFPPKHSYSKGYGCGNKFFSLDSILSKFYRGHLSCFVQKTKQGIPTIVECLLPKYIIHRYFPIIKGYSRFTGTTQLDYLRGFTTLYPDDFAKKFSFYYRNAYINYLNGKPLYDFDEFRSIGVRLLNAWKRYNENCSDYLDYDAYLQLHQKVWNLYHSDMLRLFMQDDDISLNEKYDNLDSVKETYDKTNYLPIGFSPDMLVVTDPNKFYSVQVKTAALAKDFYENIKHRSVSNTIYSERCEEF